MGGAESTIRNTTKRDSRRDNAPTFIDAIERFRDEYGHATGDSEVDMGLHAASAGIRVCVRKRPLFPHERKEKEFDVMTVPPGDENGCHITIHDARMEADMIKMYMNHHTFKFDSVFSEHCTNDDVYTATARHLVRSSLDGNNATIMMYGQTGSGKTYTMTALQERAFPDLFDLTDRDTTVTCQFVELAGDKCCDMLNSGQPTSLVTGTDGAMYPFPCVEVNVTSAGELSALVSHANSLRATAATGVHDHSSRSHAICRIFVNHKGMEGQLTLVDLAGTEHRIDSDEHNAERRKEGAMINASLSALKDCIRAHAANAKFIQYRNNRLTQLLKGCFSDSSKPHSTIVITTVAPSSKDTEHSLNTLRHACIMDGQGSGATSGSSHLTGGHTVRENLGSVDVGALGRAKFEARKKARAANGGQAPKPVDQTPKPKAAPAHQSKQSNAVMRAQLDRAGLAALAPALRAEIQRSRDPEALRDHPLQKRRLAGACGGGAMAVEEAGMGKRKKSAPVIMGLKPRSDADRTADAPPPPRRAPSKKDVTAQRSKEKLAQRPPFEVPGAPEITDSPGKENLDDTPLPKPVRRDTPPRTRRPAPAARRPPSRDEGGAPLPAFAPAPTPHAHPREGRHSPTRGVGGKPTTMASNAPSNDVEVRDKIEQLTHEANDLWREFKAQGRHSRAWRKNDLRLIATHVIPKLPSHVRPATITWMSPELALDELTTVLHNMQAEEVEDPPAAVQQGVHDMRLEAAKRKRERLQKERDDAVKARVTQRQGTPPAGAARATGVTRVLQDELAALEERLRDGGASEATRYGLKKQIGLKKAELKKQQMKGKDARPQWQAADPAPPVDPPSQPTPEYHHVQAHRTRSPVHHPPAARHAPQHHSRSPDGRPRSGDRFAEAPRPQRESQWERPGRFSSPPMDPVALGNSGRCSPPHLRQSPQHPPPQRENMWERQRSPDRAPQSPLEQLERSPQHHHHHQHPRAAPPPMAEHEWGPLGGAPDHNRAKAARSGKERYGGAAPQAPPCGGGVVPHGRRAGSSDGARPASHHHPDDREPGLRATKSAAQMRRSVDGDIDDWGPLGGAPPPRKPRDSTTRAAAPPPQPLRQHQVNTPNASDDAKAAAEAAKIKGKRRLGPGSESQIQFNDYQDPYHQRQHQHQHQHYHQHQQLAPQPQQHRPGRASEPPRPGQERHRPTAGNGYHHAGNANGFPPVANAPQGYAPQGRAAVAGYPGSPLSPVEARHTKHGRRSHSSNGFHNGSHVGAAAAPWGNLFTEGEGPPAE